MIENLLLAIISILGGAVLSMVGFWLTLGRQYCTRDEIGEMIESHAKPYDERLKHQEYRLDEAKANEIRVAEVIEKNNAAINNLNLQVAKLSVILNSLDARLKRYDE